MKFAVNDGGALVVVFWTETHFNAFYVLGEPEDGLPKSGIEREEHLKSLVRVLYPDAPSVHHSKQCSLQRFGVTRVVSQYLLKFFAQRHPHRRVRR